MKKIFLFINVCVFISACAISPVTVRLYCIEGLNKGKLLSGEVYRKGNNHGTISITMPDGEFCTGEYAIITESYSGAMSSIWHSRFNNAYGSSYVSMAQGKGEGKATALGNRGIILEVNFFADTQTGHGFGMASDSKGNIYRVHF